MDWEYINEDYLITVQQAAVFFTKARGTKVSPHAIHGWVSRYTIQVRDIHGPRSARRYRLGDLLAAEVKARTQDSGAGRGRARAA